MKYIPTTSESIDPDEVIRSQSASPSFEAVLNARLGRRGLLRGVVGTAATAVMGSLGLSACNSDDDDDSAEALSSLGFTAVSKSLLDQISVPSGYTARVIYRCGDPLTSETSAYANTGTDADFDVRAGDCHDGVEYFGLASSAQSRDENNSSRGLLAMNHEYVQRQWLFANGPTTNSDGTRPYAEVDTEVAAHGVSVVEVKRSSGVFSYVQDSALNRRVTAATAVTLSGPAAGNSLLVTAYSSAGTATRGTMANCGTGTTPWGTLLTCEENWAGYFKRANNDDSSYRSANEQVALSRYSLKSASSGNYNWAATDAASDSTGLYARWNASVLVAGNIDPTSDYRNAANTYGWVVEINPYDTSATIKKRTALGRCNHEAAAYRTPVAGQPLAFYMGDDAQGEYIYKFVSTQNWSTADASPSDPIATGDTYLDSGNLYVAKFNSDGTGEWLLLDINVDAIAGYATYTFADQADVLVNARLAADAVGATAMDRPEWSTVNPKTDEVYFTLTNNSRRSPSTTDAANPRAYTDLYNGTTTNSGNVNGHIIRLAEANSAATAFSWDIFLFGAQSDADASNINLSGLTADQDFSSPDGMRFSKSTNVAWIETDDGAYTDVTNCMLLAAIPGTVGDGGSVTVTNTTSAGTGTQTTIMGAKPTASSLKRLLVGPAGAEVTGICEAPDGTALFINIQHPGESTTSAAATSYQSNWPDGTGTTDLIRPRSATVVITKDDGGQIGS